MPVLLVCGSYEKFVFKKSKTTIKVLTVQHLPKPFLLTFFHYFLKKFRPLRGLGCTTLFHCKKICLQFYRNIVFWAKNRHFWWLTKFFLCQWANLTIFLIFYQYISTADALVGPDFQVDQVQSNPSSF